MARRPKQKWCIAGINASEESRKLSFSLPAMEGTNFSMINYNRKGESEKKAIKRKNGTFEVTLQLKGGFVIAKTALNAILNISKNTNN